MYYISIQAQTRNFMHQILHDLKSKQGKSFKVIYEYILKYD